MTDHDLWQHLEAEFARVLGEIPKPEGPTLPYDIARCHGRDWPECSDCLRRLAPDNPNGWQTYTMPGAWKPHPAWVCESRIVERGDERPTCDTPPAPGA